MFRLVREMIPKVGADSSARGSFSSLIEGLPDALVEQALDGHISVVGGTAERIFGQSRESLIGRRLEELLAPEERTMFARLVSSAGVRTQTHGEFDVIRPDGTRLSCEVSLHLIHADGPAPVLRALFRDVSERHALEVDLMHAREVSTHRERLASIGELAAGVAHEISNPLAFLTSNLSFIERMCDDIAVASPAQARELILQLKEIARESLVGVERIGAIVQALKGISRSRPNERVRFDPRRAALEAVTMFRGAKGGNCSVECNLLSLPEVVGPPGALGQVILNLLDNGLDAMGGHGILHIGSEVSAGRVRLWVRDSGAGLSPEAQDHLFEPFFTTKGVGKGTGLGLYVCQQLVAQMGGLISHSAGPFGTTFTIDLPAAT